MIEFNGAWVPVRPTFGSDPGVLLMKCSICGALIEGRQPDKQKHTEWHRFLALALQALVSYEKQYRPLERAIFPEGFMPRNIELSDEDIEKINALFAQDHRSDNE